MRALLLFVIGLLFGGAGGFLIGGGLGETPGHDHAGHADAAHTHENATEWNGATPTLSLALMPDTGTNLNLHILADGFAFDPIAVNGDAVQGTGHAHVYVNGVKVARAYGPFMHLEDVPEGATIRVTLNANDHSLWVKDGSPLAAEVTAP